MVLVQRLLAAMGYQHNAHAADAATAYNLHYDATRMKALKGGFACGKKRNHVKIRC